MEEHRFRISLRTYGLNNGIMSCWCIGLIGDETQLVSLLAALAGPPPAWLACQLHHVHAYECILLQQGHCVAA